MGSKLAVLFGVPAAWLAMIGIAAALHGTSWGQEGHPSNSVIILLYAMLGAPLFGGAGWALAGLRGRRYPGALRTSAIVLDACLVAGGLYFWISLLA